MTLSSAQIGVSVVVLCAFAAFVGYVIFLFAFKLPRAAFKKRSFEAEQKKKREQELTERIEAFLKHGPSRDFDASLTYEGWLSRVHYGRCLIDLNQYPEANQRFPADLSYVEHFPQSGSGEPSFTFCDITLFIRKMQGRTYRLADFIRTQELPAQNFTSIAVNDLQSVLSAAQAMAESRFENPQSVSEAFALIFQPQHTVRLLTASDADLSPHALKNILLLHLLSQSRLHENATLAIAIPLDNFQNDERNLQFHVEAANQPVLACTAIFRSRQPMRVLYFQKNHVFFAKDKTWLNPDVQSLLRSGCI